MPGAARPTEGIAALAARAGEADEAPVAVRELAHFGVPWTRVRSGKNRYFIKGEQVEIEEREENDGLIIV